MTQTAPPTSRTRWLALAVLCAGQLMVVLDTSIVSVALPTIQRDLGFSQSGLAWVVNAYVVAFGGLLLLSGRLGDLIGRKRMFLAGLVVFTAASLLCGVATSQELLVAARFAQGAGGAMATAVVGGMIVMIFREPRERAKAIGFTSFVAAAGGTVGGVAGGLLTHAINWHWVFFVNVPIGIAAVALAVRVIAADRGLGLGAGVDTAGAVLVTAGLMLGVSTAVGVGEYGWASARTLGFGAVAVVLLAAFVARQASVRNPLMPLRVFRSRNVAGANLVQLLMVAGMFGFGFLSVLYLQRVLGYDALETGLAGLPLAGMLALVSLGMSERLITRFGARAVLLAGLTLIAGALALIARAPVDGGYAVDVLPVMLLLGGGAGLGMPAVMLLAMSDATPADAGLVSGLVTTSASVGSALGLAVLAALATARTDGLLAGGHGTAAALNSGYHLAFAVAAGVVAAAVAAAATILRPRAPAHHAHSRTPVRSTS